MENESNDLQGQQFLPPEAIKAKFGIELTKKHGNYQKALDTMRSMYVGEDNVEEVQQFMRNANSFIKYLDDLRKDIKDPFLKQGKSVDDVHKEFANPIIAIRDEVQKKLNIAAAAKAKKIEEDRQRLLKEQSIKEVINNVILDFSVKIASADSNEQLLGYERLINLEKANKSKYLHLLPLLIERCNELNGKLAEQKKLVKQKEELKKQQEEAQKAGDDDKLNELQQKEEAIDEKIADNTVVVQEQAANAIISGTNELEELEEVKARRTVWRAELFDVKEAMKKAPELLEVSLNAEAVKTVLNTLKDSGTLKGKSEFVLNGIRYFEQKTF